MKYRWLVCGLFLLVGCSTPDTSPTSTPSSPRTASPERSVAARKTSGAALTVPLADVAHLLHDLPAGAPAAMCGGLCCPGDLNGDGEADIVAAVSCRRAPKPAEKTCLRALSGRDGTLLWELRGVYRPRTAAEPGYRLGPVALGGDLDGDGLRDLYCREDWSKKSVLLVSSKTGTVLARKPIDRPGSIPLRCHDYNDDGVADLVFAKHSRTRAIGVEVLSGKDCSPLQRKDDLWPVKAPHWAIGSFHDVDGDGIADMLLRRCVSQKAPEGPQAEFAILSGKDFSVLKRLNSEGLQVECTTRYAITGDLDGDGKPDFAYCAHAGAGTDGHCSLLRAVSAADGATLWQVTGDQLPGGISRFARDAKSGQKRQLPSDVQFGSSIVSIRDANGDGVDEILTAALAPGGSTSRQAILVFSGRDGSLLTTLKLDPKQGRLQLRPTPLLALSHGGAKPPKIAVEARSAKGEAMIAIFTVRL